MFSIKARFRPARPSIMPNSAFSRGVTTPACWNLATLARISAMYSRGFFSMDWLSFECSIARTKTRPADAGLAADRPRSVPVARAGLGGLARGGGARGLRARCRGAAALVAGALVDRAVVAAPVSPAAGLLPAVVDLVHRRPGAALGLVVGHAAALVALLDVLGLAFLLVGILRLVSTWHGKPPRLTMSPAGIAIRVPLRGAPPSRSRSGSGVEGMAERSAQFKPGCKQDFDASAK